MQTTGRLVGKLLSYPSSFLNRNLFCSVNKCHIGKNYCSVFLMKCIVKEYLVVFGCTVTELLYVY